MKILFITLHAVSLILAMDQGYEWLQDDYPGGLGSACPSLIEIISQPEFPQRFLTPRDKANVLQTQKFTRKLDLLHEEDFHISRKHKMKNHIRSLFRDSTQRKFDFRSFPYNFSVWFQFPEDELSSYQLVVFNNHAPWTHLVFDFEEELVCIEENEDTITQIDLDHFEQFGEFAMHFFPAKGEIHFLDKVVCIANSNEIEIHADTQLEYKVTPSFQGVETRVEIIE